MYVILTYLHNNIRVHLLIGPIRLFGHSLCQSFIYIFVHANIKNNKNSSEIRSVLYPLRVVRRVVTSKCQEKKPPSNRT